MWSLLILVAAVTASGATESCFSDNYVQCRCMDSSENDLFTMVHWRTENDTWEYQVEDVNSECNASSVEKWFRDTYSSSTSEEAIVRNGYQRLGDGLYKFHDLSQTWENARRTCEKEGAHLAIINSEYEASLLRDLMEQYPQIKNVVLNDFFFIGFHDMYNEGEYLTIFGEPLAKTGYNRWQGIEPNNYMSNNNGNPGEDCGAVHRNGELADVYCDFLSAFICELEDKSDPIPNSINYSAGVYRGLEKMIKPPTGIKPRTDPGEGYDYFPGVGFYRFHTETDVWENARRKCEKEGAHLAIINSEAEAQVLIDMFTQRPEIVDTDWVDGAFIGFHDQYNEGQFLTIYGEPLTTTGYYRWWHPTNPDNKTPFEYHSGQDCGGFHRNGGYDDLTCSLKHAFFCEKELLQ